MMAATSTACSACGVSPAPRAISIGLICQAKDGQHHHSFRIRSGVRSCASSLDNAGTETRPNCPRYSFRQLQALGSARRRPSPVLAIEHVPDHFASLCVHFGQRLALLGAHRALVCFLFGFGRAALRAAIRKSRLIGPQFELFPANHTCFDRKTHSDYFIEARFSACEIRMTARPPNFR